MDTCYHGFGKGSLGVESMPKVTRLLGFSEDARSFSLEFYLKPNQRYQLLIGPSFRNGPGDRLKPYLIDFNRIIKPYLPGVILLSNSDVSEK